MDFRTQIPIPKSSFPINYQSEVFLLGSCFAENMGDKFGYYKFQNVQNPFGIIFNPVSIEKLISRSIQKEYFTEADIFFHNEQWHCYDVHSKLSNTSKDTLLNTLNQLIDLTNKQLTSTSHIVITYGTSWVYKLNASSQLVTNCHKVPQKEFTKQLLSISEISEAVNSTVQHIYDANPKATIIFTVSPVRHIKDGFVENTLSKAHLISAIHQFLSHRAQSRCLYFPSYELLMDELRDYRFYEGDMLHPNTTAIDYIWEKFSHVWIGSEAYKTMSEIDCIQKGLLHKPFNPQTQAHKSFLQDLEARKQRIKTQFPHIEF